MALKFTKQNESGFPGIVETTNDPEGGSSAPPSRIKAVYEYGNSFSIELKFVEYSIDPATQLPIELPVVISDITFNPYTTGITCIKMSDDVLKISGKLDAIFTDALYKFVMPDRTTKILPANTTEEYLTLASWSPPSEKRKDISHALSLTYTASDQPTTSITQTMNIQQEIHWSYGIAVSNFQSLLAKGTI